MAKRDLATRVDVETLVHTFYGRVRKHNTLGPFFNETIEDWPVHLDKLVDFWEANLFLRKGYQGNPMKMHIDLDRSFDHQIEQAHFGHWLELWFSTLDTLYAGPKATQAKERARNMAHMLFMRIFQARTKSSLL